MLIRVTWFKTEPTAQHVIRCLHDNHPYTSKGYAFGSISGLSWHAIDFACKNFSDGMVVATELIPEILRKHYGVSCYEIRINDNKLSHWTSAMETRVEKLESAIDEALAELKKTRSWLGDRRFGKIRLALKKARETKLGEFFSNWRT